MSQIQPPTWPGLKMRSTFSALVLLLLTCQRLAQAHRLLSRQVLASRLPALVPQTLVVTDQMLL